MLYRYSCCSTLKWVLQNYRAELAEDTCLICTVYTCLYICTFCWLCFIPIWIMHMDTVCYLCFTFTVYRRIYWLCFYLMSFLSCWWGDTFFLPTSPGRLSDWQRRIVGSCYAFLGWRTAGAQWIQSGPHENDDGLGLGCHDAQAIY